MPAPCAKRLAQARSRRSARIRGARIAALAAIRDRVSRDRRIVRDAALREPCQSRKRAARASRNARARDRGAAETIEVARDGRASVIGCCALPLVPDFPILRAGSALECIRVRVSLATLRAAAELDTRAHRIARRALDVVAQRYRAISKRCVSPARFWPRS